MSLEDRLLIQDVIARYSYSYDGRDADGCAQLFVEDASFEVTVSTQSRPAVRVLSRAAIRKWACNAVNSRRGFRRVTTSPGCSLMSRR